MKKVTSESNLLIWSKPELRRIDAGSAETTKKTGVADGGTSPSATNFS
ncbi:MAG TPA: hypothetical protein VK485_04830 [Sphingomicrobium sp.]|nr:hypothetical protein [Sphingomicrobium sp.]